jgi:hypothetical protein
MTNPELLATAAAVLWPRCSGLRGNRQNLSLLFLHHVNPCGLESVKLQKVSDNTCPGYHGPGAVPSSLQQPHLLQRFISHSFGHMWSKIIINFKNQKKFQGQKSQTPMSALRSWIQAEQFIRTDFIVSSAECFLGLNLWKNLPPKKQDQS